MCFGVYVFFVVCSFMCRSYVLNMCCCFVCFHVFRLMCCVVCLCFCLCDFAISNFMYAIVRVLCVFISAVSMSLLVYFFALTRYSFEVGFCGCLNHLLLCCSIVYYDWCVCCCCASCGVSYQRVLFLCVYEYFLRFFI